MSIMNYLVFSVYVSVPVSPFGHAYLLQGVCVKVLTRCESSEQ